MKHRTRMATVAAVAGGIPRTGDAAVAAPATTTGQRVAIKPNGSFTATSQQKGLDFGVAGTYSGAVSGHFVTHQAADLTFRISFKASHASLRCNTGEVRIKALQSKG